MRLPAGSKWTYVLPAILFAGLAAGQVIRWQPFPGSAGAITALDAALMIMVGSLLTVVLRRASLGEFLRATWRHPVWKWSVLFLAWAAITLALNLANYTPTQGVVAAAYLARLGLAFAATWLVSYLANPATRTAYLNSFVGGAVALVILGFLQWIFVSDFRFMVANGWDPHFGRLLSTFYDPNYFGIFLVLTMGFALARFIESPAGSPAARSRLIPVGYAWLGLFGASWVALFLAYSRSAWGVGIIAIVGLALKWRKLVALALLVVFIVVLLIPNRLAQRFADSEGLVQTENYAKDADGYRCADPNLCDPSGSARVVTLYQSLRLIETSPLIGVGYNAYGQALSDRGLQPPKKQQSRGGQGSDSSLLTVWATTGIVGLLLFLRFFAAVLVALRRAFRASQPQSWVTYGLFWFTIAWLIGSFLNNALLYLSLLVPWLVLVAVLLPPQGKSGKPGRPSRSGD